MGATTNAYRLGQLYPAPYGPGTLSGDPTYLPTFDNVVLEIDCYAEIWSGLGPGGNTTDPAAIVSSGLYEVELVDVFVNSGMVGKFVTSTALTGTFNIVSINVGSNTVTLNNPATSSGTGLKILGGAFDNTLLATGKVISGQVLHDRNNSVRRSCQSVVMTVADAGGLVKALENNTLGAAPFGQEIRIFKGVTTSSGVIYAKLGVFLINDVIVDDAGKGVTITINGSDRGDWVSRRSFVTPFGIDGTLGLTADQAIGVILQFCAGTLYLPFDYNYYPSSLIIPTVTFNIGADPWQECQKIATADGRELFFDEDGALWYVEIPDYPTAPTVNPPVTSYVEGTNSAAVAFKRKLSNNSIPNVLAWTSQGAGIPSPITVYWWDSDPGSPTYYAPAPGGGGFSTPQLSLPSIDAGSKYPTTIASKMTALVTTAANLQKIANIDGNLQKRSIESTVISIRDQPAHAVNDVVSVLRAPAGIQWDTGILIDYVVDAVTIDLSPRNASSITARPVAYVGEY
jgi:hypothetical protein